VSDYTATLSADLNVSVPYEDRLILFFNDFPEYLYFLEHSKERSFHNSYSVGFKMLVFRSFDLSGTYSNAKARRRPSSEFDVRADEKIEETSSSLFYETARDSALGLFGTVRDMKYEGVTELLEAIDIARALNRKEQEIGLEIQVPIFSQSSLFLQGILKQADFDYPEAKWRDSSAYQLTSGIRFPVLGRMRGAVSLGYRKFALETGADGGFSGVIGRANLVFSISRFRFRAQFSRDTPYSYQGNNVYFTENALGNGISYYLAPFIRLDYDFIHAKNYYPKASSVRLPDGSQRQMNREDINKTHSAGLVIRVFTSTGLGIVVGYWNRESNIPQNSRKNTYVGAYVTYDF
jgi:hypothetical protein